MRRLLFCHALCFQRTTSLYTGQRSHSHNALLCAEEKNKREKKQTWLGFFFFFFFFNCSEIKIEDVFWLTPAAEAQAFLQVSCLAFSFFPFSLLSNKATFHIKYIGCLIAAKCISHRVGPRLGLCSLCIIRRDIEPPSHPLSLGSIHQHPPVHFLYF